MNCPDDTELQRFVSHDLEPDRARYIEDHFGGCDDCRQLAFALASAGPVPVEKPTPLGPGAVLGRFEIKRAIAEGGMGVIYEAHDPTLRRDVAIKLLHVGASRLNPDAHDRLMREAQALARLDHPNIVSVFDAGTNAGQVFIAMELIDGVSLDRWLAAQPRSWRQIVDALEQAGRGLAAAHAAGLVHRDFKPANVMMYRDGRVKVVDFGLVRAVAEPSLVTEPGHAPAPDGEPNLTITGALVGTPAYMAPEQWARKPVDERSDQFSFCVTLYEALCGVRPFATARELVDTPPAQGTKPFPRWLRTVVLRGLAAAPDARYPSMTALLEALGRHRRRTGRWVAAASALALAGVVTAVGVSRASTVDPCAGAGVQPAVYDVAAIRAGFAKVPDGDAAATKLIAALEAWRGKAGELRASACKAARVDGVESAELFDLRMDCVNESARRVSALSSELANPTPALARRGVDALERAADLSECKSSRRASLEPMRAPADPVRRVRFDQLRTQLAATSAKGSSGKMAESAAAATELATTAAAEDFPAIAADAWNLAGRMHFQAQRPLPAREAYQKSIVAAEAARWDRRRAVNYLELAILEMALDRPDDAKRVLEQARAAIVHLDDKTLTWRLLYAEGGAACYAMDTKTCVEKYRAALATRGDLDDQLTANFLYSIGDALYASGDLDGALTSIDRSLAIQERLAGKDSPALADILDLRSNVLSGMGRWDESIAAMERAFALGQMPETAIKLADLRRYRGKYVEAIELLDGVAPTVKADYGADSTVYAELLEIRGKALVDLKRFDEGIRDAAAAVNIVRAKLGDDFSLATPLLNLGRAQHAAGLYEDAIRSLRESLKLSATTPGDNGAMPGLVALANTYVDAKRPAEALLHFDKARALFKDGQDPTLLSDIDVGTARALLALKRDRTRALELLRAAHAAYTASGHHKTQADRTAALLAKHDR